MGETLAVGSVEVDLLGQISGTDMRGCWNDTTVLPDLLRDKQALNSVVGEVAGEDVAEANAGATAKVQRGILVDCLTGSNGRAKVENWFPNGSPFRHRAIRNAAASAVSSGTPALRRFSSRHYPKPNRSFATPLDDRWDVIGGTASPVPPNFCPAQSAGQSALAK